jgi:hypothetical protein
VIGWRKGGNGGGPSPWRHLERFLDGLSVAVFGAIAVTVVILVLHTMHVHPDMAFLGALGLVAIYLLGLAVEIYRKNE